MTRAGLARRAVGATTVALLAVVFGMTPSAHAATIDVTPGAVDNTVNGNCSLREAIVSANTDTRVDACAAGSGADVINAPGTFLLTAVDNNVPTEFGGPNGLPVITTAITIRGATISRTSGAPIFRILQVASGGNLTLDGVSVQRGVASCSLASCNAGFALGGGILTSGTLTLTGSNVRGNTASCSLSSSCAARGGGIYKIAGALTLTGSSVASNVVTCSPPGCDTAAGGGIFDDSGTLTVSRSDMSGNIASCSLPSCKAFGAGILNNASATIDGSRMVSNTTSCTGSGCVAEGGAIYNNVGTLAVTGGTAISGNNTSCSGSNCTALGGGIFKGLGAVTLANATVSGNSPDNCRPPGSIPGCVN